MDLSQRFHEHLVGHSLNQVTHGSSLKSLVDILVPLIGSEHNKTRFRIDTAHGSNDFNTAFVRQPEVHQSNLGPESPVQLDRFLRGPGLPDKIHILLRLDNSGNTKAHDRMIVADKNSDFLVFAHMLPLFGGDCNWERRMLNDTVVPCCGALTMPMRPPMRSTRSRMPSIP